MLFVPIGSDGSSHSTVHVGRTDNPVRSMFNVHIHSQMNGNETAASQAGDQRLLVSSKDTTKAFPKRDSQETIQRQTNEPVTPSFSNERLRRRRSLLFILKDDRDQSRNDSFF